MDIWKLYLHNSSQNIFPDSEPIREIYVCWWGFENHTSELEGILNAWIRQ